MRLHLLFREIMKPHTIVLVTASVSFLAWVIPWPQGWRTGYFEKQELGVITLLGATMWYVSIAAIAYIGYLAGTATRRISWLEHVDQRSFYLLLSLIAIVGAIASYSYIILDIGATNFISSLLRLNVNSLRHALPYRPGLYTLRYAAIPAAAYAMYRVWVSRRICLLDVLNLLSLIATSLLASRLSLMLSIFLLIGLIIKEVKISIRHLLILLVLLFMLLTILNWTRNAHFYKRIGIHSPLLASMQETITYLGAPFQVQAGLWDMYVYPPFPDSSTLTIGLSYFFTPTYFQQAKHTFSLLDRLEAYREYIDLESTLTTNSAFASLYALLGLLSFPVMWIFTLAGGFITGHFARYNSPSRMVAYAMLYAFAELWRVYLFNSGIIHFVILTIIGAAALSHIRVFGVLR